MKPSVLWKFARTFCRIMTSVWFDLKVYGLKHVPTSGAVLLVTNHQSYLDPMLIGVQLFRQIHYFAKSELFENWFFGWFLGRLGSFPVRQGKGDTSAIRETLRRLREGCVLNIFPEGSRSEDGEMARVERGAALVIRRVGEPIAVVPVAIDGAFNAWPRSRKLPLARPVSVMFGPPLDLEDMNEAEITQLIDSTLRRMIRELREAAEWRERVMRLVVQAFSLLFQRQAESLHHKV